MHVTPAVDVPAVVGHRERRQGGRTRRRRVRRHPTGAIGPQSSEHVPCQAVPSSVGIKPPLTGCLPVGRCGTDSRGVEVRRNGPTIRKKRVNPKSGKVLRFFFTVEPVKTRVSRVTRCQGANRAGESNAAVFDRFLTTQQLHRHAAGCRRELLACLTCVLRVTTVRALMSPMQSPHPRTIGIGNIRALHTETQSIIAIVDRVRCRLALRPACTASRCS